MAEDLDELETNPFYKALQAEFLDLFEKAQSKCYWICVPQSESLTSILKINRDFAETHILRPSPLFRSHFESLEKGGHIRNVTLSDAGDLLNVRCYLEKENQVYQEDIKILSEELAYNKDYQQYKILILERPLHPRFEADKSRSSSKVTEQLEKDRKLKILHTHKISVQECNDFLNSFNELQKAMSQLEQNIAYFLRHYMVLADYLGDASRRLEEICAHTQKAMMTGLSPTLRQDIRFQDVLAGAVESCIMSKVYTKVFPVVCQHLIRDDKTLLNKYDKLNKIKPEQIGVANNFSCPLPSAVVELANLGSFHTPREKLYCLKATVDNVTEGVASYIMETKSAEALVGFSSKSEPCLTSDDLIPILVIVIAQAKCSHLSSDLFYVEQFMWDSMDRDRDDLSYCLVTFKAAVQYMISTDFSHLEEMKNPAEKEISIEDLLGKERRKVVDVQDLRTSSDSKSDRLDRQLNRISDLLEKSRVEMGSARKEDKEDVEFKSIFPDRAFQPPPDVIPATDRNRKPANSSPLGDFLSALQNDDFDQAYGKQS